MAEQFALMTITGQPTAAKKVTVDWQFFGRVYKFVNALTEVEASATLNFGGLNPSAGETVTIAGTAYTFVSTFTAPNQIMIGATDPPNETILNLGAAVNQTGTPGVEYSTGTQAPAGVTAAIGIGTFDVFAIEPGVAGNSIAVSETMANGSWSGATLSGGVDSIADEVVIGGDAQATVDNIIGAINGDDLLRGNAGGGFSFATPDNPVVSASDDPAGFVLTVIDSTVGPITLGTDWEGASFNVSAIGALTGAAKRVATGAFRMPGIGASRASTRARINAEHARRTKDRLNVPPR